MAIMRMIKRKEENSKKRKNENIRKEKNKKVYCTITLFSSKRIRQFLH
jgi:hypothetical protein